MTLLSVYGHRTEPSTRPQRTSGRQCFPGGFAGEDGRSWARWGGVGQGLHHPHHPFNPQQGITRHFPIQFFSIRWERLNPPTVNTFWSYYWVLLSASVDCPKVSTNQSKILSLVFLKGVGGIAYPSKHSLGYAQSKMCFLLMGVVFKYCKDQGLFYL